MTVLGKNLLFLLALCVIDIPDALSFAPTKTTSIRNVSLMKKVENNQCIYSRLPMVLGLEKRPEEDPTDKNKLDDKLYIEDTRLLACDLLAILIGAQVLGLSDVLASNDFWKNGGIVQPVTLSSFSTFSTLINRYSLLSICWVAASVYKKGYSLSAVADDLSVLKSVFSIFTDFCSLLIIASLIIALSSHSMVDGMEIAKEAWFTILVVGTFRFTYSRSFYQ